MAYTAPNIKDRVAVGDDLYTMTEVDGKVKLIPSPTEVVEPGTEINKAFLQPLCDGLEAAWVKLLSLAKVATSGSYDDLIGIPSNLLVYNITSASYSADKYSIPLTYNRYVYLLNGSAISTKASYDDIPECISFGFVIKNDTKILSWNFKETNKSYVYFGKITVNYDDVMHHQSSLSPAGTAEVAQVSNSSLLFGAGNIFFYAPNGSGPWNSPYNFIGTIYLMPI